MKRFFYILASACLLIGCSGEIDQTSSPYLASPQSSLAFSFGSIDYDLDAEDRIQLMQNPISMELTAFLSDLKGCCSNWTEAHEKALAFRENHPTDDILVQELMDDWLTGTILQEYLLYSNDQSEAYNLTLEEYTESLLRTEPGQVRLILPCLYRLKDHWPTHKIKTHGEEALALGKITLASNKKAHEEDMARPNKGEHLNEAGKAMMEGVRAEFERSIHEEEQYIAELEKFLNQL